MIGRLLRLRARWRMHRLRGRSDEVETIQERLLLKMVRRAEKTAFGREFGFDKIHSAEEFRARVPTQDYDSMLPRFERMRDGAVDEIWPGRPVAFARTAGTSGGSKYLPLSASSIRSAMGGALDALSAYVARARDKRLLRGRFGVLTGSLELEQFDSGVKWGDIAGILAARLPGWLQRQCAPGPEILAIPDWEERLRATAADLVERKVRVLAGAPSWLLVLIDAVEELAGRPIRDVWPEWRGLIHGGVAFAPYAKQYRRRIGRGIVLVNTYAAPQGGLLAVQDLGREPAMLVLPDRGVFFEFVRVEDPKGPRLGLHEVEPDVPYLIHVTTDAGLWAHRIGDVVRFASVRPPRLLVTGRDESFLNAFGESVAQEELEDALAVAARSCHCEVREFAVVPEYPRADRTGGRHLFLVEFDVPPPDLATFEEAIDGVLRACNEDYRTHRAGDLQLLPPHVRLLRRNAFYDWMKATGRLGGRSKVPRVLDSERARGLLEG